MKFFINTPQPMCYMRAVTTRDLVSRALEVLQRGGMLHPEQSAGFSETDRAQIERDRAAANALLADIEKVLACVSEGEVVRLKQDVEAFLTRGVAQIEEETRDICNRVAALHRQKEKLDEEKLRWSEISRTAILFADRASMTAGDLRFDGRHIFSCLALLPRDEFAAVERKIEEITLSIQAVETGDDVALFMIARRHYKDQLEELVARYGRMGPIPPINVPLHELVTWADDEIAKVDKQLALLQREIATCIAENLETLVLLREALMAECDRLRVLEMACALKHVVLIEGWVPENAVEKVSGDMREEVEVVYLETRKANIADEPPIKLRNAGLFQPFEVLVELFATPKYREWDPTPIVAYFFALFFGIMLGDAAYGLLLVLLIRFLLPKLTDDPESIGFRKFKQMLYICAGSTIVVGVLTGSYFGDFPQRFFGLPDLALSKTIQGAYMDPMVFIIVSLGIGLIHVNLGHALMFARGILERKACHIIGRGGLFLFEAVVIVWILDFIGVMALPGGETFLTVFLAMMGFSVVLIIIGSMLEKGPYLGAILWIFDVSGILGDVMSYARLAGVGMATYFLAYCFNMMSILIANMLPEGFLRIVLGSAIILFVLVFGHLLNLMLGVITCFVHSLRLCFVEFLFKFYEGGGRPFAPLRLRRREMVPVRSGSRVRG